eukprot:CAMPEP_0115386528 /NCGR_PEP_ID=MMETSP0271-20121206/8186_1 /TAXON_ID=71861 /ORGANISM="Scrippsiella trochoidea, Strain CCMP3099" /LENGTH=107 /DNA_ID=CAMNT_0002809949 /DNA_START=119 /DNA_END=443 /DNA_ORIENTATION=+
MPTKRGFNERVTTEVKVVRQATFNTRGQSQAMTLQGSQRVAASHNQREVLSGRTEGFLQTDPRGSRQERTVNLLLFLVKQLSQSVTLPMVRDENVAVRPARRFHKNL